MGIVMEKYWQMVEENKDIVPDDIYEYLLCSAFNLNLKPTKVEKERFFVYGNKELSQAVYNFLCFNIKPYMYMYASEYGINILLRGFEDSSDLIYFAKVVSRKVFQL